MERIVSLLKRMRSDLDEEQTAKAKEAQASGESCSARSAEVEEVGKVANTKRAEDERQLPLMQAEQRDKERQIEDKEGQEERNNQQIEVLTVHREATRAEYIEKRDELNGLVATLKEARRIIAQLVQGQSFL